MRYPSDRCRALPLLLVAFAALSGAPDVSAQPVGAAGDTAVGDPVLERAREAFRRGVALAREHRHAEAVESLRESDALKPHPTTRYNTAVCLRELGQHAGAYAAFASSLAVPGESPGPELVDRVRRNLEEELAALGAVKLIGAETLTSVQVDGASVVTVTADGQERLLAGAPGTPAGSVSPGSEIWMDPGEHVLVVRHQGEPDRTFRASIFAGIVERLEVGPPPPPPPPPRGARANVPARPAPPPPPFVEAPDRTWAYVSFGAGGAALIASGVFAALSLNEKSYLEARCGEDRVCPVEYADERERMVRYAAFATVGLVVGAVGVGAGTYLWLRPPTTRKELRAGSGSGVHVFVGGLYAGVTGRF